MLYDGTYQKWVVDRKILYNRLGRAYNLFLLPQYMIEQIEQMYDLEDNIFVPIEEIE